MNDEQALPRDRELVPFTDSLASLIRWRFCDYAAIVGAELDLMLSSGAAGDRRSSTLATLDRHGRAPPPRSAAIHIYGPSGTRKQ